MAERLQKVLARAGYGSRRACEILIKSGRVTVDDQIAIIGLKVDPRKAEITVDGQPIKAQEAVYIKLNKPGGVLSSSVDELNKGRPTIRDIVDLPGHLYPIGRLDKNSQGLMLLTNDGELTLRLTHPRYEHLKSYRVEIEGRVSKKDLDTWQSGIWLDGRRTAPVNIQVIDQKDDCSWLQIEMREGRKRQIRRSAALLGYSVRSLIRERIGPIELGDLPVGSWRFLTDREVQALKTAAFDSE